MGSYGIQNGGKGYKPPYPSHEAMCAIRKSEGKNTGSSMSGSHKVTEGRKPPLLHSHGKAKVDSEHGSRGYQTPKARRK
jgi:hypothetical protein